MENMERAATTKNRNRAQGSGMRCGHSKRLELHQRRDENLIGAPALLHWQSVCEVRRSSSGLRRRRLLSARTMVVGSSGSARLAAWRGSRLAARRGSRLAARGSRLAARGSRLGAARGSARLAARRGSRLAAQRASPLSERSWWWGSW
jgi:hypothetical protein